MDDGITIYHNPRCSNSRAVLALLQERHLAPRIVEYLSAPLDREHLEGLVAAVGLPLSGQALPVSSFASLAGRLWVSLLTISRVRFIRRLNNSAKARASSKIGNSSVSLLA